MIIKLIWPREIMELGERRVMMHDPTVSFDEHIHHHRRQL